MAEACTAASNIAEVVAPLAERNSGRVLPGSRVPVGFSTRLRATLQKWSHRWPKGTPVGFSPNRLTAKSAAVMGVCGQHAVLGFNLNKLMNGLAERRRMVLAA
jgi:hypothetical protein